MSRSFRIVFALLLAACSFAVAASTAPAPPANNDGNGNGNEDTTPCNNCGGKVTFNDVQNLKRQSFEWTTSVHNSFFAPGKKSTRSSVIYKKAMLIGPGSGEKPKRKLGWLGKVRGQLSLNKYALKEIGLYNRCRYGNTLVSNRWGLTAGCFFSGDGGWNNVHGAAPGAAPKVQGGTQFIAVRLWRSCEMVFTRGQDGQPDFQGYRSSPGDDPSGQCTTTPILERIPPAADNTNFAAAHYWRTRRDDGTPVATTASSGSAISSSPGRTAGILYRNCDGPFCSARADGTSRLQNRTSADFQRSCRNGVLAGTQPNWSEDEMSAELEYTRTHWRQSILDVPVNNRLPRSRRAADQAERREARYQAIKDWIGGTSRFPSGISATARNIDLMCSSFSEHLSLDWSTGRSGSMAKIAGNIIPNRLYLVTYTFMDSRENIINQKLQYFSSAASRETKPEDVFPLFTSGPTQGSMTAELPKAGFIGTRSLASVTASPSMPTSLEEGLDCDPDSFESIEDMPALCPKEFESEWPAPGTDPADEEKELLSVNPNNYSLWAPRSAAFGVYNPLDHSRSAGQGYQQTHQIRSIGSNGDRAPQLGVDGRNESSDRLFGPFASGPTGYSQRLASVMQQRPLFGTLMPLFVNQPEDAPNEMQGQATVEVDRTTETPASDNGQVDARERWEADETRAVALIGENRYQRATWRAGKESTTRQMWRRLTMDRCSGYGGEEFPKLQFGNGQPGRCNANERIAGSDWQVKDAYDVPGTSQGSGTRFLDALFTQERTGPATLVFQSSPIDGRPYDAAQVSGAIAQIQVFSAEEYNYGATFPTYTAPGANWNGNEKVMRFGPSYYGPAAEPTDSGGSPVFELPQGQYVVRFVLQGAGGYTSFRWGATAYTWSNTQQEWVSRFDVLSDAATAPIYRTRNAG